MTTIDIKAYGSNYASQYESSAEDWFETALVRVRRRRVLNSLGRHRGANVLEVGCGLEPLFGFATDWTRWTIVEPVAEFVKKAEQLSPPGADITVVQGYLEQATQLLNRERGPFDFIVVSSLLHEVPDPALLLSALHELSTPDTVLHLNVPNVRSFHRILAFEMGLIESVFEKSALEQRFQRTTRFDLASLRDICERAGFDVLHSETYFIKPFTNAQMAKMIDSELLDPAVIDGLDAMSKHLPELGAEMLVELKRNPSAQPG